MEALSFPPVQPSHLLCRVGVISFVFFGWVLTVKVFEVTDKSRGVFFYVVMSSRANTHTG